MIDATLGNTATPSQVRHPAVVRLKCVDCGSLKFREYDASDWTDERRAMNGMPPPIQCDGCGLPHTTTVGLGFTTQNSKARSERIADQQRQMAREFGAVWIIRYVID